MATVAGSSAACWRQINRRMGTAYRERLSLEMTTWYLEEL